MPLNAMPALLEIQRAFAGAMQSGDCAAAAEFIAEAPLSPQEAIGIYRNTFISGATKALRLSFPAIERLTGADFFAQAAEHFIAASPPRSGCLDDYGAGFAEFLENFEPAAGLPWLPEVARLEWAVNAALHADDAKPLHNEDFAVAAAIAPARLVFTPHPSLSLLKTAFPADAIWRAVLAGDDAALSSLSLEGGPFFLLVCRDAEGVQATRISESAHRFLSALCAGDSFAAAFDAAPSDELPSFLAECFALGRFTGFREIEP
jgi:putative DNA-binding protein